MDLTPDNKEKIDAMPYERLLSHWRFAPAGDPWFQGETGSYWSDRMRELRDKPNGNAIHVAASKILG